MKQILKLVFLLVIGQTAFAQAPSNYTNINGRYRWIAGMFDSTFHIPKGSTPSLRTGGSTNSGGLFYNTSDSSVYTYTGTQWIKLRGSINPSDTTNKYVTQVYKKNASDSVFYVKGGNHLFAFIDSVGSPGGGGGGKVYYFNGGVSMGTIGGFQMYELGDTANTGAAANFTRSTTGNIANFITDPGKPGLLQIPAGVWSVDAWLSETGGGANHAEIWVEVEKWDGSTITTIATSPIEQITEGATPNLYSWSVSIPTTSLTVTDRIVIQFYISNTNGKTVTLYTQNGYVGEVHTTFTTGIGAINGLTAPAQYLVTGSSGTDFNINSSTATHTFNLPTASATNRGALSTTDWTTFNNKIGGSLVSGYLTKATGTNTIDTSQIYQSSGKIGIGRTNPTAKVDVYDSLGTGIKSTLRTQINTDVALDVKAVGNRGFALIVDQADSSASGTQYQTLFRKSMMPGTGNPANGGGVSWYTQIGNDNNVYRALSVYRARVIDSTGFANSNIQQTSTEFWTRKAGVWDTTLVLNGGNVGVNTGQNGIDSALTVANGTWLKRGVRMSALPTGVGTKALRIDANGNVSTTDTTATTGFVPYTGATTSLDMGLFNIYGQNIVSNNYATGAAMSSISRSDITASAYGVLLLKRGVWGTLQPNPLTAFDKNWYLPDTSGTLALASQLSGYVPTTRTITINGTSQDLSANRTYNVGTVTSVATNTGTGITGGTITTSGTIAADTLLLSTRAWRQKGVDSVASLINTRISGTTNYIPKFTSSSAIGNSAMYESGGTFFTSTNALNVRTNTSRANITTDADLVTQNGLGILATSTTYGQGYQYIRLMNSASAYTGSISQTESTGIGLYSASALIFGSSSTERMRLDASGNLLVGTSTASGFANRYIELNDATDNTGINFKVADVGQGYVYVDDSNNEFRLSATGASNVNSMTFFTGGTERARLDASGNLGLGVTPSAWLSTYKALQFGIGGALIGRSDDAGIELSSNAYRNSVGSYNYLNTSASTSYRQYSGQHQWFNAPSGTAGNAISFTQAMTLDASGRLGIGVTNPQTLLSVNGSARLIGTATSSVTLGFGTDNGVSGWSIGNGIIDNTHNFRLYDNTNSAVRLTVDNSGNVGIGTTSPGNKLTVNGDIAILAGNGIYFNNSVNTANSSIVCQGGGSMSLRSYGTEMIGLSENANILFSTGGSERMRITSGGNVLVGTTSDAGYKLSVNGSLLSTYGYFNGTGAGTFNSQITLNNTTSSPALITFQNTANGHAFGFTSTGTQRFTFINGGLSECASITSSGAATFSSSVTAGGIVSSATEFRLNNQTYSRVATLGSGGDFGGGYNFNWVNGSPVHAETGSISGYGYGNDGSVRFYTNSSQSAGVAASERMRLNSSGELLINTTSDAGDYKLQVNGSAFLSNTNTTVLRINGTAGYAGILAQAGHLEFYRDASVTKAAAIGFQTPATSISNDMQFAMYDGSTWSHRMTLTNAGNLEIISGSIKTAAPSGGTAKPWKLGEAGVSVGGANTTAVKVEIDGVVYYLLTAYLPEPAPEPAPKPKPEG